LTPETGSGILVPEHATAAPYALTGT
jgi:hypothetical protein